MGTYKVKMMTSLECIIEAEDEEQAIEIAWDEDKWQEPFDYGTEEYSAIRLCKDWSCDQCGSGWLEEIGVSETNTRTVWCPDCKSETRFTGRVREVSDPNEELATELLD